MLVVPAETLARSNAPFADAARVLFGDATAVVVAALAAVSAYGALNGWILLQGELPQQMARDGVFPRPFAQASGRDAPVFALVSTSVLVTALVLMNTGRSMVDVFTFMALLSTTANLVAYLACSLALIALQRRGQIGSTSPRWLAATAAIGAAFSLWAIVGAGWEPVLWGAVLIFGALPVYWLMRRSALPRPQPAQP
jgi:APA family basic amino acid/polyamine antiporter